MWQWGVANKCSPPPLKFNWIGLLPIQLNLSPNTHQIFTQCMWNYKTIPNTKTSLGALSYIFARHFCYLFKHTYIFARHFCYLSKHIYIFERHFCYLSKHTYIFARHFCYLSKHILNVIFAICPHFTHIYVHTCERQLYATYSHILTFAWRAIFILPIHICERQFHVICSYFEKHFVLCLT